MIIKPKISLRKLDFWYGDPLMCLPAELKVSMSDFKFGFVIGVLFSTDFRH